MGFALLGLEFQIQTQNSTATYTTFDPGATIKVLQVGGWERIFSLFPDTFKTPSSPWILVLGKKIEVIWLLKSPSTLLCSSPSFKQILEGFSFPQISQVVVLLSKIRHASEIKLKTRAHLVLPESDYGIRCQCKQLHKHIPNPLIPLKISAGNSEWEAASHTPLIKNNCQFPVCSLWSSGVATRKEKWKQELYLPKTAHKLKNSPNI